MRLIDADTKLTILVHDEEWHTEEMTVDDLISKFAGEIPPTIDTVPVRKGEWIRTGKTNIYGGISLQCPFCGDGVMVTRIEDEIYCRHCGAKLRKEE